MSKTPQGLQEAVGWRRVLQTPLQGGQCVPQANQDRAQPAQNPQGPDAKPQCTLHTRVEGAMLGGNLGLGYSLCKAPLISTNG